MTINLSTETLVTHKGSNFKEIIKRTNLIDKMISVSGKNWEQKKINQNLVDKLKQDFDFNDIVSRLIISREFE